MKRAPTVARGYGQQHRRERARWAPIVAAGHASCCQPVCLMPSRAITPGTPWDLAHDPTRTRWLGPAHRRCNRRDGMLNGAAQRRGRRKPRRVIAQVW